MSSALFFSASLPSNNTPQSFTNKPNPSSSNANISSNPLKTLPKPHNSTKFFPPKTNNNIVPNPISDTDVDKAIKMPTAPWMTTPILLPSNKVPPFSKTINKHTPFDKLDRSLTDKVRGRRGRQAMRDIIKSVTKLQQLSIPEHPRVPPEKSEKFEFGFGLKLELERVGEEEVEEVRVPWGMSERGWFRRMKKEKVVTAAELSLPALVIERLRSDAKKITQWVKVNKVGMSQAVVDEVKMTWRNKELVMLKFELPLCRNMDRALEIVETQTGGLVVWRKKDTLVVYRGCKYESSKDFLRLPSNRASTEVTSSSSVSHFKVEEDSAGLSHKEFDGITGEMHNSVENSFRISAAEKFSLEPVTGTLYEREADRLLDGLGPRFVNWWWRKPLPVDADMLPKLVPGFMTPFRLCPPNLRPTISDDELTYLRKTARSLPTHFALGRNTKLQGLASAVIKLWEKSLIVKIAVKWGIPNTNNEQMAWELKCLTGGIVILRNKFFIILYRGKDFLPSNVANRVLDRERELKVCQYQEEGARWKALKSFSVTDQTYLNTNTSGTFSEFHDIQVKYGFLNIENRETDVPLLAEKEKLEKELRNQEHKLFILNRKIEKSAKELYKLNSAWRPEEVSTDQELITEEERQCFRKVGLKMAKVLVLGRRGVFDGVIGSVHQHWKHREVVKVVTMRKVFSQVIDTASLLEIESGGILIAVEKLRKGHAIILYRGKNYRRPLKLLPGNLLTKKKAFNRSLEMQRIGSLKFFAYQRRHTISKLKLKLRDLQRTDRNMVFSKYSNLQKSEQKELIQF